MPLFSFFRSHFPAVIFATCYLSFTSSTVLAISNAGSYMDQFGISKRHENAHFIRRRSSQQCSLEEELVWLPSAGKQPELKITGDFLDLSGNGSVIAMGRSCDDIRVYQHSKNNDWIQLGQNLGIDVKLDVSNREELGRRSLSFSFNGKIVAIGGCQRNGHHYVKIYEYIEKTDSWNQLGEDIRGEGSANYLIGETVSMSDDGLTVAVGTKSEKAEVYHFRQGEWMLKGSILLGNRSGVNDHFGEIVHLSGDGSILAICAKNYVKVLKFNAETQEWFKLGNTLGYFGFNWRKAVSMSKDGSTLAMAGTRLYMDELQVFRLNASFDDANGNESAVWEQIAGGIPVSSWYLVDFTFRLSGDGNVLVVGDAANDDIAESAGRVQVYQLDDEKERDSIYETKWKQLGSNLFSIDKNHSHNHDVLHHRFGSSVAVSDDGQMVVATSSYTASNAVSTNTGTYVFKLACGPSMDKNYIGLVVGLLVGGMAVISIVVAYYTKKVMSSKIKAHHKILANDSDIDKTVHMFPVASESCDVEHVYKLDEVGPDVDKE